MCERCVKIREECEAEIRDLMNYNREVNGPLSAEMKARVQEGIDKGFAPDDEDAVTQITDVVRMQLIAQRCAIYARACPKARFAGAPASIVLGVWAGEMAQDEMMLETVVGEMLRDEDAASRFITLVFGNDDEDDHNASNN